VRELFNAIQNLSVVCCWGDVWKRSRGDGFDDTVCAEGICVQLNLWHCSTDDLKVGW
jgi:hypothetical protein